MHENGDVCFHRNSEEGNQEHNEADIERCSEVRFKTEELTYKSQLSAYGGPINRNVSIRFDRIGFESAIFSPRL